MSRSRSKKRKAIKATGRDSSSNKRTAIEDTNDVTWIPTTTACYICQRVKDEDLTILCDGEDCSKEVHLYCLQPPLLCIPSGKWYCDTCSPFGTTKPFLKYLQHHECSKSLYLEGARIEQPEFAHKYQIFMNSLRSKIAKNIEDLRFVLDDDIPPSEFINLPLVGCRVDIWNSLDGEIHSGRILAERINQNLEKEHLVQFRSGINGRNSPLIVWMALEEHISVVYRDIFMLRYGHSCLWQPVQCALRSGLYRLYDRRDITSSTYKKLRSKRKSVNSKYSKNKKSKDVNPDDSESSDIDNDDNIISRNDSIAIKTTSTASDLAFFSFLQPDFIVLESIPQNNCRPFFNWDYHSLRLNKATLFAIMEARAEAEEQFSVVESVKHRSLKVLETKGLLDIDNGDVNIMCLARIAEQYRNNWKGNTNSFGLSGNAYGNFVRKSKSSSMLNPEEEQIVNFQQDLEVFEQSEKLLIRQRMFLHYQEHLHHASKSLPIDSETISNDYLDNSDNLSIVQRNDGVYDLIKSEVHEVLQSICNKFSSTSDANDDEEIGIGCFEKATTTKIMERMITSDHNDEDIDNQQNNDIYHGKDDVENENMETQNYQDVSEDALDVVSDNEKLMIVHEDEKEIKAIAGVKEMDVDNNVDTVSGNLINDTYVGTCRTNNDSNTTDINNYEVDEEKEYETRLTCLKQFRELSAGSISVNAQKLHISSHEADMSAYFLDPTFFLITETPPQTVLFHHLQPWTSLCDSIDCCYQIELAAEQARQEAEKLEKQRLKKAAAATVRSEKQRKQRENAEKRRLAAIERKQARDILLKEMYHQDATIYNNDEPTSPKQQELSDVYDTCHTQVKEKTTRMRKPKLAVSDMIINDSIGEAKDNEIEDNWKLMEDMDIEGGYWDDAKEQDTNTEQQFNTATPARFLSKLNRVDWFDQIVSFSSFSFPSSASSGMQYGRVVGCDTGMAIVKLSGGVLQHISPVQLEIVEKNSHEFIKFSIADALEENDTERHDTTQQQPPADFGDHLLSEPINDFIPVDFSFDLTNPAISNTQQQQPPIVKRKPPPPERKIRVIDFAALLSQNEDKDLTVVAETQKKPVRQPLLQAVKLDQITQQKKLVSSHAATAVTPSNSLASDNNNQVNEKVTTVGAHAHSDAVTASLLTKQNSISSQNTAKPSATSTLLNARKPSIFNIEIKKYGRGVGSIASSSASAGAGSSTVQFASDAASVANEKGEGDNSSSRNNSAYATTSNTALSAITPMKSSRWSDDKLPIDRSISDKVVNSVDIASKVPIEEKPLNMIHPVVHTTNVVPSSIPPSTSNYLTIPVDNHISYSVVSQSASQQPSAMRKSRFGSRSEVSNIITSQTQSASYDTSQLLSQTHSLDHTNSNASTAVYSEYQLSTMNAYDTNTVNLPYVQPSNLDISSTAVSHDISLGTANDQDSFGSTMYANNTLNSVGNSFNTTMNQPLSTSMKPARRSRFSNVTATLILSQDETMSNLFPTDQTNNYISGSDKVYMPTHQQPYDVSGVFIPQPMSDINIPYPSNLQNSHDMSQNLDSNTNNMTMTVVTSDHTMVMTNQFMPHPTPAMNGYVDSIPDTPSIMPMPQTGYSSYEHHNMATVEYLTASVGDAPYHPQFFPDNLDNTSINDSNNLQNQTSYSSMMYNNNHCIGINNNSFHQNNDVMESNRVQLNAFGPDHHMYNMVPVEQHIRLDYNAHNIHSNDTANANFQNKNRDPRRNKSTKNNSNNPGASVNNNYVSRTVRIEPTITNNNDNKNAGNKTDTKSGNNNKNNNNNNYHEGLTKSQRRRLRRQEKQDQFQRSLQQLDEEMHHIGSVLSHDHQNPIDNANKNKNNAQSMFTIDMADLEDGEVCEDH